MDYSAISSFWQTRSEHADVTRHVIETTDIIGATTISIVSINPLTGDYDYDRTHSVGFPIDDFSSFTLRPVGDSGADFAVHGFDPHDDEKLILARFHLSRAVSAPTHDGWIITGIEGERLISITIAGGLNLGFRDAALAEALQAEAEAAEVAMSEARMGA